jgi:hypothetical protein
MPGATSYDMMVEPVLPSARGGKTGPVYRLQDLGDVVRGHNVVVRVGENAVAASGASDDCGIACGAGHPDGDGCGRGQCRE